ncbi:MAG: hypothetical protein Q8R40_05240 [bacterium]|nr:hypothetical protein [bacterium]
MNPRTFIISFAAIVSLVLVFCMFIYALDLPYSDLDMLRQYQMNKLNRNIDTVETVILGDSSAGNAIDAELFSELSEGKTLNLGLAGSFGLESDYDLIQYLRKKNAPQLKNIIIMHTLDLWSRNPDKGYYLDTKRYGNVSDFLNPSLVIHYFAHTINFKRAVVSLKRYLSHEKFPVHVDLANDYIAQRRERYSNGLLSLAPGKSLLAVINPDQKKSFAALAALCKKAELNCVYVHGLILETMYQNSFDAISEINEFMKTSNGMSVITDVLHYPEEKMGDSEDHIDNAFKKEVTKEYWKIVTSHLL